MIPNPADSSGKTKILDDDLYFRSSDNLVWDAHKGDITDGASIPGLFQPIIGGPFEPDYLPAAVLHDHYTNDVHKVRTWRATDRMFYEAMIAHQVAFAKAQTMYYAVYVFGPHWDYLQPGVPCGPDCIRNVAPITMGAAPAQMVFRPADYSRRHKAELARVEKLVNASTIKGQPLSLDQLDALALKLHPADPFLNKPAGVATQ